MSQDYADIPGTDTLSASLAPLLARDDAVKSSFEGTTFPSTLLLKGQLCYRSDQALLYICSDPTVPTWVPIFNEAEADARYLQLAGSAALAGAISWGDFTGGDYSTPISTTWGTVGINNGSTANYWRSLDFGLNGQANPIARVAVQHSAAGSSLALGTSSAYASGVTALGFLMDPNGQVAIDKNGNAPNVSLDVYSQAKSGFLLAYAQNGSDGLFAHSIGAGNAGISVGAKYDGAHWVYTQAAQPVFMFGAGGAGTASWFAAPAGTVGATVSWVEMLRLTSGGNVEIATNLQVDGNISLHNTGSMIRSDAYAGIELYATSSSYWAMESGAGLQMYDTGGTFRGTLYHDNAGNFGFLTQSNAWGFYCNASAAVMCAGGGGYFSVGVGSASMSGNMSVTGTCSAANFVLGGYNVWSQGNLTAVSQLSNNMGYLTPSTVNSYITVTASTAYGGAWSGGPLEYLSASGRNVELIWFTPPGQSNGC